MIDRKFVRFPPARLLLRLIVLAGIALLYACTTADPGGSPAPVHAEGAGGARQPVDEAQNRGSVVFAPAGVPGPIDSTLLLDREKASVSLRVTFGEPVRQGQALAVRDYKMQFRNGGDGAVAISEVMILAGSARLPVEMGSVVVPAGRGYILSVNRRTVSRIDPREDVFLTFKYEGRPFQALIHKHQLVYVIEAPS